MISFSKIFEIIFILPLCVTGTSDEDRLRDFLIERTSFLMPSWRSGRNFPLNTKINDLRNLVTDYDFKAPKFYEHVRAGPRYLTSNIPDYFDAREKWPHCKSLRTVRDQGRCGSCWAVAVAATMSDRTCIASDGRDQIEYSVEDIMTCCDTCLQDVKDPCKGGSPMDAFNHWALHGFVSGGEYGTNEGCKPYPRSAYIHQNLSGCKKYCTNKEYKIPYEQDKHFSRGVYVVRNDTKQMQAEIMTNGPVQTHYIVYEDFFYYKGGVYTHVWGRKIGKHCVKIIGWGTENGKPYWLVANTWGKKYGGLNGIIKILRGENHCEIETIVLTGLGRPTQYSAPAKKPKSSLGVSNRPYFLQLFYFGIVHIYILIS